MLISSLLFPVPWVRRKTVHMDETTSQPIGTLSVIFLPSGGYDSNPKSSQTWE